MTGEIHAVPSIVRGVVNAFRSGEPDHEHYYGSERHGGACTPELTKLANQIIAAIRTCYQRGFRHHRLLENTTAHHSCICAASITSQFTRIASP